MIAAAWAALAGLAGLIVGIVIATVAHDRDDHRRWLERISEQHGPDVAAVAEAEWIARKWTRAPWRWFA